MLIYNPYKTKNFQLLKLFCIPAVSLYQHISYGTSDHMSHTGSNHPPCQRSICDINPHQHYQSLVLHPELKMDLAGVLKMDLAGVLKMDLAGVLKMDLAGVLKMDLSQLLTMNPKMLV